jgi:thymidylate synthase (FAD)
MKVKAVSITKSLIVEKDLTAEQLIVYCGRISNPENQLNLETSEKLLAYLIKHKHWSPFEMADMAFEVTTSRGIAQQILRHRSFSFQEFSQRYSEVSAIEPLEIRIAGSTNRQSSLEVFNPVVESVHSDDSLASDLIEKHFKNTLKLYKDLISAGVAKECARGVLPISTQSTLIMKGSVRSWIHYFSVRCDEHTQKEHRDIAFAIREIFISYFPAISKALNY